MLKTNNKQFIKNLHAYIMDNWNIEDGEELRSWEETKESIINSFNIEAYSSEYERRQNDKKPLLVGFVVCLVALAISSYVEASKI